MRFLPFSTRNTREIVRDPISAVFGIGLPVALLLLITMVNDSIGAGGGPDIFRIERFTPGIAMFSMSFLSLFGGILIAGDRGRSFLLRLFSSPMRIRDYMLGYSLPLVLLALLQITACFCTALALGLELSFGILLSTLALLPCAVLFIGLGLLFGSLLSEKQAGPISSIVVQVAALSSGMWFDLDMIGGVFKTVCEALPFVHAVSMAQGALIGNFSGFWKNIIWVSGYATVFFVLAAIVFKKRMKN